MSCSLQSWRASLLFCLGLFLHCGEARVNTEVQAGPLYRVVGSLLSVSCNVSGFADSNARKEFEFSVKKPPHPMDINVISTKAESFSYAMYSQRVKNKEITLTHVTPNSVVFEIQRLEKSDEGEFECYVINPESAFDGIYSAKTMVKVIDNSLSVSSPGPTSLNYNEGDALILICQASSNTVQHTHLSLTWYLHKNGEENPQMIISLDRDFTLTPGQGFEERYQDGIIRLNKLAEATYTLQMDKLELSDQGKIYCQAQEWIQDPDRSWYSITQKTAEEIVLSIKAKEVLPATSQLAVRILAQPTVLQEGQELSLSCSIDTQNPQERFFTVAWLRGNVELALIGPTGILSVGPEYNVRAAEGELRAARRGVREYHLNLRPVRTEDQGEYICRAWPQVRSQDGAFTQGAAQDSTPQNVRISATEDTLSLEMQSSVTVNEGDSLKLTCKVQGVRGQLSVTWQHKPTSTPAAAFTNIISLNQEGVMEKGAEFASRNVTAVRPAVDTFTLEVDGVTPSDSGVYQCAVSEWKINSKIISQSHTAIVTVTPTERFLKLSLITRNSIVTVGENVELICQVKGLNVPMSLTWSLQRDASSIDNILTLYSDGSISWSGDQHRYQLKVQNKGSRALHYLLINGASHREAGRYQCSVSVFVDNVHKKLPPSNQLAVHVQNPASKLVLISDRTLTRNINTDIEMKCSVTSEPSPSSRYSVTWLLQQQVENKTIISSDRDALVTFGPQLVLSNRQRISMKRTQGPTFELGIRQAQISDSGSYICEVVEWLQDPQNEWYQLPSVSTAIKLTLIEPVNDLRLDPKEQSLFAKEGDDVQLECNIIPGASSPSYFYKVSWDYTGHDIPRTNALVELDHTGLLSYPENQWLRGLQQRLHVSRPNQTSFYLSIQRAHEGDSGTYRCHIEQYKLDYEGNWQQKASESAGPIVLTINVPGQNLSIVKEDVELNVSTSQDFTIPCDISQQSSYESEFQVTWLWQKDGDNRQWPLFTSYRNATLQVFEKGDQLRFSHPLPNHFKLTILKPGPEDNGLYFCEVEEWLPSLSHGWRKVAMEKSGYLSVNVYSHGSYKESSGLECSPLMWIVILVAVVFCSLLVICVLVLKICWGRRGKKSKKSLWTESVPLNTKTSAEK